MSDDALSAYNEHLFDFGLPLNLLSSQSFPDQSKIVVINNSDGTTTVHVEHGLGHYKFTAFEGLTEEIESVVNELNGQLLDSAEPLSWDPEAPTPIDGVTAAAGHTVDSVPGGLFDWTQPPPGAPTTDPSWRSVWSPPSGARGIARPTSIPELTIYEPPQEGGPDAVGQAHPSSAEVDPTTGLPPPGTWITTKVSEPQFHAMPGEDQQQEFRRWRRGLDPTVPPPSTTAPKTLKASQAYAEMADNPAGTHAFISTKTMWLKKADKIRHTNGQSVLTMKDGSELVYVHDPTYTKVDDAGNPVTDSDIRRVESVIARVPGLMGQRGEAHTLIRTNHFASDESSVDAMTHKLIGVDADGNTVTTTPKRHKIGQLADEPQFGTEKGRIRSEVAASYAPQLEPAAAEAVNRRRFDKIAQSTLRVLTEGSEAMRRGVVLKLMAAGFDPHDIEGSDDELLARMSAISTAGLEAESIRDQEEPEGDLWFESPQPGHQALISTLERFSSHLAQDVPFFVPDPSSEEQGVMVNPRLTESPHFAEYIWRKTLRELRGAAYRVALRDSGNTDVQVSEDDEEKAQLLMGFEPFKGPGPGPIPSKKSWTKSLWNAWGRALNPPEEKEEGEEGPAPTLGRSPVPTLSHSTPITVQRGTVTHAQYMKIEDNPLLEIANPSQYARESGKQRIQTQVHTALSHEEHPEIMGATTLGSLSDALMRHKVDGTKQITSIRFNMGDTVFTGRRDRKANAFTFRSYPMRAYKGQTVDDVSYALYHPMSDAWSEKYAHSPLAPWDDKILASMQHFKDMHESHIASSGMGGLEDIGTLAMVSEDLDNRSRLRTGGLPKLHESPLADPLMPFESGIVHGRNNRPLIFSSQQAAMDEVADRQQRLGLRGSGLQHVLIPLAGMSQSDWGAPLEYPPPGATKRSLAVQVVAPRQAGAPVNSAGTQVIAWRTSLHAKAIQSYHRHLQALDLHEKVHYGSRLNTSLFLRHPGFRPL